jgi:hypothetical protein
MTSLSLPDDAVVEITHDDGAPAVVTLRAPWTIDGMPCAGTIDLFPNGRLEHGTLAASRALGGFDLTEGDSFYLREDGSVSNLYFQTPRKVRQLENVRGVNFDEKSEIESLLVGQDTFNADGVIVSRQLAERVEMIDGVACTMFAHFRAGRLVSTILGDHLATPHGTIPAGSSVRFHPDGSVDRAQISASCVLAGQPFERNDPAHFHADRVEKEGWVFYVPE